MPFISQRTFWLVVSLMGSSLFGGAGYAFPLVRKEGWYDCEKVGLERWLEIKVPGQPVRIGPDGPITRIGEKCYMLETTTSTFQIDHPELFEIYNKAIAHGDQGRKELKREVKTDDRCDGNSTETRPNWDC